MSGGTEKKALDGFTPLKTVSSISLSRYSAAILFQDETLLLGESIGAQKQSVGEVVFTTSMTGFQESLTDPSFAGQILAFAYPLIGNYGVSDSAFESLENKVWAKGVIVKESCKTPAHYASKKSLNGFLREQNVPGIAGVDTRAIVQKIREHGVLPGALMTWGKGLSNGEFEVKCDGILKQLKNFDYSNTNFVEIVSEKKKKVFVPKHAKHKIALIDYGAKTGIVRDLVKRNCEVTVFPHSVKAEEILEGGFDGIMLSNGPGDPALLTKEIREIKKLVEKKPVFGICLGHQLLAWAFGGKTFKLKFGHRGANHSVKDVENGKALVTSQNHGYAVDESTLPPDWEPWFRNANDDTNEGIRHKNRPFFSVQFHPEAAPGPTDTEYLFDEYVRLL